MLAKYGYGSLDELGGLKERAMYICLNAYVSIYIYYSICIFYIYIYAIKHI